MSLQVQRMSFSLWHKIKIHSTRERLCWSSHFETVKIATFRNFIDYHRGNTFEIKNIKLLRAIEYMGESAVPANSSNSSIHPCKNCSIVLVQKQPGPLLRTNYICAEPDTREWCWWNALPVRRRHLAGNTFSVRSIDACVTFPIDRNPRPLHYNITTNKAAYCCDYRWSRQLLHLCADCCEVSITLRCVVRCAIEARARARRAWPCDNARASCARSRRALYLSVPLHHRNQSTRPAVGAPTWGCRCPPGFRWHGQLQRFVAKFVMASM